MSSRSWRARVRSLRLRLPLLLLAYCAVVGVAIYLIVDRTQERRFEAEFAERQLARATDLQDRTERAAERNELDTAQREFGELAQLEPLRGAVFVSTDSRVLLGSRREWLNRSVDLAQLGVPRDERWLVEDQMRRTLSSKVHGSVVTNGGDGLVLIMPASLPLVPGALAVDRDALILLVYDLSLAKAVNAFYLRQLFLLIAGAVVLGAFVLGVGLHVFVTRRLENVQGLLDRFEAGGDIDGPPSRIGDEIGEIGSRFNEMAHRVRRANRALRAISHCNQALVHASDEPSLLKEICRVIVEDGGYRLAWVAFNRAEGVVPAAQWGADDGYIVRSLALWDRLRSEPGALRDFLLNGQTRVTRDFETDPFVSEWRDEALKRGFRSSATFALREDGRTFGALMIYSDQPDAFDEHEMKLLTEMAEDLAYGIQARRTHSRRERAEDELRQSQSRLMIATDMAKLAPWEYDAASDMYRFNDTFYSLLGTTAEAEGGTLMSADDYARTFLPPDEAYVVRQEIDRSMASDDPQATHQLEHRFRRRDGSIGHMQVRKAIVKDASGATVRTYGVNQDITERKQIEESIRAANERYARHESALAMLTRLQVQTPDQFPDVVRSIAEVVAATLDIERVSVWRRQGRDKFLCEDIYERSHHRHSRGAAISGEVVDDYARALAESDIIAANDARNDLRISEFSKRFLQDLDIRSHLAVPIRSQGEMIAALTGSSIGVERRWTPDEQTFMVAVANLLSSLFAQLERQRLEAQLRQATKLEGIGQLAGGVAHDFNNVLTVIIGKAGHLIDDPRMPGDLRQAAEDIIHSADRAANLTRQLLAFSRRQTMQVRDHDLNDVIRNVARLLDRLLGEELALELDLAAGPVFVRADAGMIDQVVLNLAVNARDAMKGRGRLVVRTSVVEIDTAAAERAGRMQGPYACLRVSDTGAGIAHEHLPHIFEPFFTTKDVGKGTGLGLATTYGIVQQHNGWIEVESEVGRGTTFSIYLPNFTPPAGKVQLAAAVPAPAVPRAAVTERESILVVEDEDEVRSLIVDALTGFGYRVLEAGSGPQALELWRTHAATLDLVITDMVMPGGMNGLDLASQMKQDRPGIRIIYISGYLADVSRDELSQSEDARYLAKPFTLPSLARLVRQSLDQIPLADQSFD